MLGVAVVVVAAAAVNMKLYDRLIFFIIKTTSNAKKNDNKIVYNSELELYAKFQNSVTKKFPENHQKRLRDYCSFYVLDIFDLQDNLKIQV